MTSTLEYLLEDYFVACDTRDTVFEGLTINDYVGYVFLKNRASTN